MSDGVMDAMLEDGQKSVKFDQPPPYSLLKLLLDEIEFLGHCGGLWSLTASNGSKVSDILASLVRSHAGELGNLAVTPCADGVVYIANETWGSAADGDVDRLVEVLRNYTDEHGKRPYEHVPGTTVNHKKLQAVAIELKKREAAGEEIPEALAKAIKISIVPKLKSR